MVEAERERNLEQTNDGRIAAIASGIQFGRISHSEADSTLVLIRLVIALEVISEKTARLKSTYFRLQKSSMSALKII